MTSNYIPPIYNPTGSMVSAAASAQLSTVELELSKIRRSEGIESPEAAAARIAEKEKKVKRDTLIVSIVASCAVVTAFLAMYIEASLVTYVAFAFPLFTAPYVVRQRRKLDRLPTLREEHNKIRILVNELTVENQQLEALNTKIQAQVSRLDSAEAKLEQLAKEQGANLTDLNALISENGRLLREMRCIQESKVMTECLKAIMSSDHSRDWLIDEDEMKVLIMRLQAIDGVHVNETELRAAFAAQKTSSVQTIVGVTKELLQKDQLQIVRDAGSAELGTRPIV